MSVVKDLFTEKNGQRSCPLRMLLIVSVVFYLGMELRDALSLPGYQFSTHGKDFASGLADLLGLGGGAVAGKSLTESDQ